MGGDKNVSENTVESSEYDIYANIIYDAVECDKEEKFVNLMIQIIVSLTLKEFYEESH